MSTPEIFRILPWRREVLAGLLGADLIGFHIYEYARNFYTTCRRILGLNHEFKKGGFLVMNCYGRTVMIRVSHIGIEIKDIEKAITFSGHTQQLSPQVKQFRACREALFQIVG